MESKLIKEPAVWRIGNLGVLFLLFASSAIAGAESQASAIRTSIGYQPSLDRLNGATILRYELLVTNDLPYAVTLMDLQVTDQNNRSIFSTFGPERLAHMGNTKLVSGESGIIYLDIELKRRRPPEQIATATTFTSAREDRTMATIIGQLDKRPPVILGSPLGPGPLVAVHSEKWPREHRRMPYAVGNVQRIPDRFAVEFVGVGMDGGIIAGDPDSPVAAIGYATPLFAVADAVVAHVSDGMKEVGSISANGAHGPATAAGR
jgi:murein DD-endopeptidase